MKKAKTVTARDYREFCFTATGDAADPKNFTAVDLFDNLSRELERLKAISSLLESAHDELDSEVVGGIGLILRDIAARSRVVLETFDRCRSRARDKP